MQLAFTTADELFALLEREGEALDYRDVWPRLFPVGPCSFGLMRALVEDIVANDERFTWESDVHVGLAHWRTAHRDLSTVAFTVVDLETTGSTPGFAKITEIGAVRVEHGQQIATFSQLVNPQMPIPTTISAITGITAPMVREAPPIQQVLPTFVHFADNSVLVAHNARFDLAFLDYELGILERRTFSRPCLDTMRLARRLLPHVRASLAHLAAHFDTQTKPSHRALADAQATAEILLILLAMAQERGLHTLEEVARFCEPSARRNYHKIVLTEPLPAGPGVYIMQDEQRRPLYIGKAENLRRRTRDHFLQKQAHGARQALELLHTIRTIPTGSEFEALLLELRLIAQHKPPYNDHGTRAQSYQYVKLTAEEYPRLYATPNRLDDGAVYAGPFRKAGMARRLVDCLNSLFPLRTCTRMPAATAAPRDLSGKAPSPHACQRFALGACLGPCRIPLNGEYQKVVGEVSHVLRGEYQHLDGQLERRQEEFAKLLAYEQAARTRDFRETLTAATRTIRRLREALGVYAIVAYPAVERHAVALWGIAGGQVVSREEAWLDTYSQSDAAALVAAICAAVPPHPPLPPEAIDEVLLIGDWVRHHRSAPAILELPPPGAGRTAAALTAAATSLVTRLPLFCKDCA